MSWIEWSSWIFLANFSRIRAKMPNVPLVFLFCSFCFFDPINGLKSLDACFWYVYNSTRYFSKLANPLLPDYRLGGTGASV